MGRSGCSRLSESRVVGSSGNNLAHRIFVAELVDVVPRRRRDFPNLFVGLSRGKFASHDQALQRALRKNKHFGPHFLKPAPHLVEGGVFPVREEGKPMVSLIRQSLAFEGYTVNPLVGAEYKLYVVDLDPLKLKTTETRCVYVGQTSIDVESRIAQHRRGHKAARVAPAFLRLNEQLTPRGAVFRSQWDAIAEETLLGKKLQDEGYKVWGPSGINE